MKRCLSTKSSVLVLFAIALIAQPIIYETPAPHVVGARPRYAKKLVVLSIDGARPDITYDLASQGFLPGFKRIMDEGVYSEGMMVSFPSATAVSHATISTGADPSVTGITGNRMHLPGMRVDKTVWSFGGEYLLTEPIWVTTDRQGMRAVVANFPMCMSAAWAAKVKNSMLLYSFGAMSDSALYTTNKNVLRAVYVTFVAATEWTNLQRFGTVNTPYETSVRIGDSIWWLLVYDSNSDDVLDKLAIVPDRKDASRALTILSEGEWSKPLNTTVVYRKAMYAGAPLFKAIRLSNLKDFRLYMPSTTALSDPGFRDEKLARDLWNSVVSEVGLTAVGDSYALTNEWIDAETYMETVRYAVEFSKRLTEYLFKNTEWNLLMTYTPVVDEVYHQFLGLISRNMPYYDPKQAPKYEEHIKRVHMWADEILQVILRNVNLADTAVIVVSDHGQWALKKVIHLNGILCNAGLVGLSEAGNVLWSKVKAYYAGDNQIFVNLKDREDQGTVGKEECQSILRKVKEALLSVVDPDDQEPVFEQVMSREEASILGLAGERVGDIVFSLRLGYTASGAPPRLVSQVGRAQVSENIEPLRSATGGHGDLPTHKELWAIFGAIGPSIIHQRIGTFKSTSIAPTITEMLGIDAPLGSTGIALTVLETKTVIAPTTTQAAAGTGITADGLATIGIAVTVLVIVVVALRRRGKRAFEAAQHLRSLSS